MRDPTVTVRVPEPIRRRLAAYAKAHRSSRSAVIIEALNEFLEHRDRHQHVEAMNRELERLAKLERESPDLREFYEEPGPDLWGDVW